MVQTLTPIAELFDFGEGVQGLQGALAAATDTALQFENSGDIVFYVDNQDVGARTVTLVAVDDPFGRGAGTEDVVLTVAAGDMGFFPFMNPAMFNSGTVVNITLDATTSTSVGIYKLKKRT